MFTSTIRDNIAYGRSDATMEEVISAARVAQLHDEIDQMDQGYETFIGERGVTLSGGQRQRLSIARAVLLDPPVLILDDSTSSVDASTEDLILRGMEELIKGRTTFIISHRISAISQANEILVLDNGRVVERGSHSELLLNSEKYRRSVKLQVRSDQGSDR